MTIVCRIPRLKTPVLATPIIEFLDWDLDPVQTVRLKVEAVRLNWCGLLKYKLFAAKDAVLTTRQHTDDFIAHNACEFIPESNN